VKPAIWILAVEMLDHQMLQKKIQILLLKLLSIRGVAVLQEQPLLFASRQQQGASSIFKWQKRKVLKT